MKNGNFISISFVFISKIICKETLSSIIWLVTTKAVITAFSFTSFQNELYLSKTPKIMEILSNSKYHYEFMGLKKKILDVFPSITLIISFGQWAPLNCLLCSSDITHNILFVLIASLLSNITRCLRTKLIISSPLLLDKFLKNTHF